VKNSSARAMERLRNMLKQIASEMMKKKFRETKASTR
jgi:hypothetical protein